MGGSKMKQTIIQMLESKRNFALDKQTKAKTAGDLYSEGFWRGVALEVNDAINLIGYLEEATDTEIVRRYNESD
jgi:hypothetical protein